MLKKASAVAFIIIVLSMFCLSVVNAQESTVVVVYFTGVGCPHCARTDPFVLIDVPREYQRKFIVIEYEVYQHPENSLVYNEYDATYDCGLGVPNLLFGQGDHLSGDYSILANLRGKIDEYISLGGNKLPLVNGSTLAYTDLQIEDLPGSPKIWGGTKYSPLEAPTILAVVSAAVLDAINPCAFAVLVILLSGVISSGGRKKALKAGLAFTTAVFIMYLLMGFGILSISMAPGIAYYFYKAVGIFALVVGVLNIKDYFWEDARGVLSSMPESWRPRVQKWLDDITSIPGALVSGFIVSLFLLPCTSGPYIVVLALLGFEATKLYATQLLFLYNFIFVLPMIIIVLAVYFGLTTTAKAAHFRHRTMGLLHLIAGALMFMMGIWMLFFY